MACRRAVSPVLAVVILMGIAVVGGGLLASTQNVFLQTALSELKYTVTDLRLEKDNEGGCYLFLSIYNSGSEVIQKAHFKTVGDSGHDQPTNESLIITNLEPARNATITKFFDSNSFFCGNFTASNTYSFSINASSADSTYTVIKAVKVKEVSRA